MHPHSIEAYNSIRKSLTEKQLIVLSVIEKHAPITSFHIGERLKWAINRVTGRVSELKKKGIIEERGKLIIGSSKHALLCPVKEMVNSLGTQHMLFDTRERE